MASKVEVLISNLRLRKTPGLKGTSLGFATKGVHEYTDTTNADGYKWYHIEGGYIAHINGDVIDLGGGTWVQPTPVPANPDKDQVYVGDVTLRIRKSATTGSTQMGVCDTKVFYNVSEVEKGDYYTWYKIGDQSWIAGVDEVIYYPSGSSRIREELLKEITRLNGLIGTAQKAVDNNQNPEVYDELYGKITDLNKYIDENFDLFDYDLVDPKEYDEVDLLYTADVHGAWVNYSMDGNYSTPVFSYADLSSYRDKLEKNNIKALLVDAGDWSRPGKVYTDFINTGVMKSAQEMKNKGYLLSTFGNHEWRWSQYGEADSEAVLKKSSCMTACNLFKNGKLLFKPYRTAKIGSKRIGIIGVGYPSANGAGDYANGVWTFGAYTFYDDTKLFNQVQKYINELKDAGFDYIVVVSHMCKSTYESDSRYIARTDSLIKNTKGLTAVIQGHYNYATNAETIKDKGGNSVLLAHESGANMNSFGRLKLKGSKISSYLLDERSDLNVI